MMTHEELEKLIAEELERQFNGAYWTGGAYRHGDLLIELDGDLNISELVRKILQ